VIQSANARPATRWRGVGLLRTTGMHLSELRRMIMLETALPLVATTVSGGDRVDAATAIAAFVSLNDQYWGTT
jgi:hypothetical protein